MQKKTVPNQNHKKKHNIKNSKIQKKKKILQKKQISI